MCRCTFCINTGSVLKNEQMNRRGEGRSRNIGHVRLHLLKCSTHWILAWSVGHVMSSLARPSLKSALRPPPSALAESANFRPFYVKRADFSPPPPATKKRRKLVKIRPRCPHLATKKRRKVVKIRPCGGWWVGGWSPPLFFFNLITVKWSWYKIGDVIDVIKVINMTDVMNVINQCK